MRAGGRLTAIRNVKGVAVEQIEQSSQYGPELALFVALAAIIVSPVVSWLVMWFQERAATRRFNAKRDWQRADEFRREVASLLSTINEQAGQMLMLQEYGPAIAADSLERFDVMMVRVDQLDLTSSRIGQSVHLLIDRESEDGEGLVLAMIELSNLISRTPNRNFPEEPIFKNLGSQEAIGAAATKVSKAADKILKQLDTAVK